MPKPSWTESDMDSALFDMSEGLSLRKAAANWGIPPQTLSDRFNQKSQPKSEGHQSQQRLTLSEEKKIVEWILKQEKLGYAPSAGAVKAVVTALLKLKNDTKPLGTKWIRNFKKHHPQIHHKKGTIQESIRFNSFTPKTVN